ncbi:DNA (cytosine-5)-methyltransferase 3A, partial [Frankliniella fusca]
APKSMRYYGQRKVVRKQRSPVGQDSNQEEPSMRGIEFTDRNHDFLSEGEGTLHMRLGSPVPHPQPDDGFIGFECDGPQPTLSGQGCRPIIVLSLFDGISTGLVCLKKLGIPVLRYFASEVCGNAKRVQTLRHPEVIQMGDVRDISEEVLSSLGRIDLLLAGSPCSDLSRVRSSDDSP